MQKGLGTAAFLTMALLLDPAGPGLAGGRGTGPREGHGAIQARGSGHPGPRAPVVASHRPFFPDRFRGRSQVGTRVLIAPGFGWGVPWWWDPAYPYYAAPPVVVQEAPPVDIQPEPAPQPSFYWYYCPNPAGYYPYIKDCPPGWMTVVPPANPPAP